MTIQARWKDLTKPLLGLVSALGLEALEASEKSGELLVRNEQFPTDKARGLSLDVLRPLAEVYGDALTFRLMLGALPILTADAQIDEARLAEFRRNTERTPNLILDLKLNKTRLLQLWGVEHPWAAIKLFLFPAALARALSVTLIDLEQDLLCECKDGRKVVVLVSGCEIALDGDYVAVVGGAAIEKWQNYVPLGAPNRVHVEFVYNEAIKSLKWVYFSLKHLTPLHLKVKGTARLDDPVARTLYAQLVALSLVYTADQSKMTGTEWRATFAAESYVAEILIGNADALAQALLESSSEPDPWLLPWTLAEIAEWAYSGERGASDRLGMMQGVIAHALQGNDPLLNYREILRQAGHLKQEVEWGWGAFIEGKLNVYFSRVRDVEQAVDTTVKDFSEQVQAITKALLDNALAAVGVVIGSFIAAAFKDNFNTIIFRLGVGLYAAYLFIFPGLIGLVSVWQRCVDVVAAFNKRKVDFSKRLFQDEVDKIVGTTIQDQARRFRNWFVTVIVFYAIFVIILVMAAWFVPPLVTSQLTTTPIAPSTATSTVVPPPTETSLPLPILTIVPGPTAP